MTRRNFIATSVASLLLLAVVVGVVLSVSDAQAASEGSTYSKTFTSQCSGGTVEVWHPEGYASGSRVVTVTGTYSAYGKQRDSAIFVAVSTGHECSRVKVETVIVVGRTPATVTPMPTTTPTPTPTPSATPVSSGLALTRETTDPNIEERLYRADGSFITDGSAVERSTGSVTYDSELREDVFTPTGQATCIGGFYYSGLRKNGQYSQSRCMTEEEAEEFGWTSDNLEGLEASTTEPDSGQRMDELQSGKAGKRYINTANHQRSTGCLLPTDPVPSWPSSETKVEACTVP